MEQATEHANLAERFASDKSRLDLAWQHFHMAADCYLKAIEETQDEEASFGILHSYQPVLNQVPFL